MQPLEMVTCPRCNVKVTGYNIGLGENLYHSHWSEEKKGWVVIQK